MIARRYGTSEAVLVSAPIEPMRAASNGSGAGSATPKRCAGYAVYDPLGQKIGVEEELFLNRDGEPQYIRVRIGFFGARSVLIPVRFVETDEKSKALVLK
jgi:hypothetical protein